MRENEDAAKALGVNATAVKLGAMTLSAAITAAAGCFYVQYFLFIDAGIAYGPWISIEALLAPIIGGVGTVFGAAARRAGGASRSARARKLVTGDAPGLDLVIYGVMLVAGDRLCAARRASLGAARASLARRFAAPPKPAAEAARG